MHFKGYEATPLPKYKEIGCDKIVNICGFGYCTEHALAELDKFEKEDDEHAGLLIK
jgi:hypothetical protein